MIQVLAYVTQVHGVVLPEDLIDYEKVTLEQVTKLIYMRHLHWRFLIVLFEVYSVLKHVRCSPLFSKSVDSLMLVILPKRCEEVHCSLFS